MADWNYNGYARVEVRDWKRKRVVKEWTAIIKPWEVAVCNYGLIFHPATGARIGGGMRGTLLAYRKVTATAWTVLHED